jgi:undecaprenyl diphosphate synthase
MNNDSQNEHPVHKAGGNIQEKRAVTAASLGISPEQMPRHIAIIMDGNGRWATSQGLPRYEGHREGGKTVERIVQHCVNMGVECLTLYSFSMENWKRPEAEVSFLMFLYTEYLLNIRPMLMRNNVRLVHLGREEHLPPNLIEALHGSVQLTAANTGMVLAIALNYSSRCEITDAVRKIAARCKDGSLRPEDIDEKMIDESLYTSGLPDPDLVIRTSNELRISNFLLWQISYSEFHVSEKMWPQMQEDDIRQAILAFAGRQRRFGDVTAKK